MVRLAVKKQKEEKLIEEGSSNLSEVKDWISNVDTKVSIMLALMGIFLGYILVEAEINLIERISMTLNNGGICNLNIWHFIKGGLIIALYVCVAISMLYFLKAIRAKINPDEFDGSGIKKDSLLFFGSVANMEYKDYMKGICDQKNKDKLKDVYSQVYINSRICNQKFIYYNKGIDYSVVAIVIFVICKLAQII